MGQTYGRHIGTMLAVCHLTHKIDTSDLHLEQQRGLRQSETIFL